MLSIIADALLIASRQERARDADRTARRFRARRAAADGTRVHRIDRHRDLW